jgi:NADP-dependent 3-hydroxy acid dehydrogenase YdfG
VEEDRYDTGADDTGLSGLAGIVTGAARGIGAATARALCGRGMSLLLLDVDEAGLVKVADEVGADGGMVSTMRCDVRDFGQIEAAIAACRSAYGGLDVAVANAAVVEEGPFADGDPDHYRNVIETNLLGLINTARAAAPSMRDARAGHIVLLASVSGRETYVGQPVYIATKWGIVGFGRSLRKELLVHGIRVTLIEPGLVDTDMARSSPLGREFLAEIRALRPEDVARAIVYALEQPAAVAVNELVLQPLDQAI